ncbi:MAG: MarR family winged helix-turn-helix transcriptional regulator [Dehalococcoidia bacterium]
MSKPADPSLLLEAWLAFLRAHSRVVPRVSQELEIACEISLAWFDVLQQLSLAPECRRRMTDLADAVLLSKSGLTRLVDRIEAAGLVNRAAVPGNRRSLYVQLTPEGRRLVAKARPAVQRSVADHFGRQLSEAELATLRDSLARLAQVSTLEPDGV